MTITQHHLAVQAENERLKKENELMKQIASTEGFYDFYFKVFRKKLYRLNTKLL
ncbi:hypothetical protein [Myroides sp. DF42-4-2]|uniref:hypothetical protein n=1 Tax=unclassified Myroides TaxID=2642485 RepID=UPI002574BF33|nr:hypothetical protein [Myroides sp. DF42-4-2]MDM1408572.1 hypothetical protein [Myroides sp. DF42-4-2]